MIRVFVHADGATREASTVDPAWLQPGSGRTVWVDLAEPTDDEGRLLVDVFGFHDLAVESALQREMQPKIESYGPYLYLVLHGIKFQGAEHRFDTHETDFFLGPNYLVTVHDGKRRSIAHVSELCERASHILAEGPVALLHRIIDTMVDHYRPEADALEDRLDEIEKAVIEADNDRLMGDILAAKRDISTLRRIVVPQRDAVGRLARREFEMINQEMAYRFRDVYDQFARIAEDAIVFQDRVTGILDAHLASVSNRLADVSRLLAVIATLFGPLTVITGLFGMNVPLPSLGLPGTGPFWEVIAFMVLSCGGMYIWFRKSGWL
ncbi:MAG: magnesium transporter CorA family protein [Acidobacteria bacterium]|nr:magnesium transporter CorA family protein [Acidobacteriota bacterium]